MDLTWRDAVSSLAMAIMVIIYGVYVAGGFWLISSTWATAAVLLIIGLAGRVISVGGNATPSTELFHRALRVTAAAFVVVALFAGLTALILGSAYALGIFIMSSIVVQGATVLSHI
jgi:hypothetical protein